MELKGVNALNKDLPLSTWRILYGHSVNGDDKTRPLHASQLEAPLSSGGVKLFFSYITKAIGPSTWEYHPLVWNDYCNCSRFKYQLQRVVLHICLPFNFYWFDKKPEPIKIVTFWKFKLDIYTGANHTQDRLGHLRKAKWVALFHYFWHFPSLNYNCSKIIVIFTMKPQLTPV